MHRKVPPKSLSQRTASIEGEFAFAQMEQKDRRLPVVPPKPLSQLITSGADKLVLTKAEDHLSGLSSDLQQLVLNYLTIPERLKFASVSQRMHEIVAKKDPRFWRNLIKQYLPHKLDESFDPTRNYKEKFLSAFGYASRNKQQRDLHFKQYRDLIFKFLSLSEKAQFISREWKFTLKDLAYNNTDAEPLFSIALKTKNQGLLDHIYRLSLSLPEFHMVDDRRRVTVSYTNHDSHFYYRKIDWAIICRQSLDEIKKIMMAGSRVKESTNGINHDALTLAMEENRIDVVDYFIKEQKAQPDVFSILKAAKKGHGELVNKLIDKIPKTLSVEEISEIDEIFLLGIQNKWLTMEYVEALFEKTSFARNFNHVINILEKAKDSEVLTFLISKSVDLADDNQERLESLSSKVFGEKGSVLKIASSEGNVENIKIAMGFRNELGLKDESDRHLVLKDVLTYKQAEALSQLFNVFYEEKDWPEVIEGSLFSHALSGSIADRACIKVLLDKGGVFPSSDLVKQAIRLAICEGDQAFLERLCQIYYSFDVSVPQRINDFAELFPLICQYNRPGMFTHLLMLFYNKLPDKERKERQIERQRLIFNLAIDDMPLLFFAIRHGSTRIVAELLKLGVTLDDYKGLSPFYFAALHNKKDILHLLLTYISFSKMSEIERSELLNRPFTKEGYTMLHCAVRHGNLDVVSYLVSLREINVNAVCKGNLTPLHIAIHEPRNNRYRREIVARLLLRSPKLDIESDIGETPVAVAIRERGRIGLDTINKIFEMAYGVKGLGSGQNCDIDQGELKGYSPIFAAVRSSDLILVKLCTSYEANVNATDEATHTTLLHIASKNPRVVAYLVKECGAHATSANLDGDTPLYNAIINASGNGDGKPMIETIIKAGGTIYTTRDDGDSVLHLAVLKKSPTYIELLFKHAKAVMLDINVQRKNGMTPLHTVLDAAESKDVSKRVTFLLKNQADIYLAMNDGSTPLHMAAKNNQKKSMQVLIKKISNDSLKYQYINYANDAGATALHLAVEANASDAVVFLLNQGANASLKYKGFTACEWAIKLDHHEIAIKLKTHKPKSQSVLLENSPVLKIKRMQQPFKMLARPTFNKKTTVFDSEIDGDVEMSPVLETQGVPSPVIKESDKKKEVFEKKMEELPLFSAIESGNLDRVKALVWAGRDVNQANAEGVTPLMKAVQGNYPGMAAFLVTQGARLDHQDNTGMTALMWATINGFAATVELLLKYKARADLLNDKKHNALLLLEVAYQNKRIDRSQYTSCRVMLTDALDQTLSAFFSPDYSFFPPASPVPISRKSEKRPLEIANDSLFTPKKSKK